MKIKIKELAQVIGGEVRQGNPALMLKGVGTDSRNISRGRVFFALIGERFDGHQFVKEAAQKGAIAAVVKTGFKQKLPGNFGLIQVPDPLFALGELARCRRAKLGIKVAAITGSVGKTTSKEMTALILAKKFKTAKTQGNFNNLIGLPLTIFEIPERTEVAVLELASNQPGEIARLAEIAQPDLGVITRIAEAHLEGLENLEGVEKEKRALVSALGANGIFIFNLSDPRLSRLAQGFAGRKIGFGLGAKGCQDAEMTVRADQIQVFIKGGEPAQRFQLKISGKKKETGMVEISGLGEHLVENALAAIAVGKALGISLKECARALLEFKPIPGRGKLERIRQGLWMIDDSYNSNPASVKQALKVFSEYRRYIPGEKILILGEMKELGKASCQAHQDLGGFLTKVDFDQLHYLGGYQKELAAGLGKRLSRKLKIARDLKQLKARLEREVKDELRGGLILIKGSHIIGLWKIAGWLRGR